MTLPNFIIAGAMKSGTSSLYRYLTQHPQVFMSEVKEPNYFIYAGSEQPDYPTPPSMPDANARWEVLAGSKRDNNVRDFAQYQRLFTPGAA